MRQRSVAPTNGDLPGQRDRLVALFAGPPDSARAAILALLTAALHKNATQPRVHSGTPEAELSRLFREATLREPPAAFADYAGLLADVVAPHSINMSSPRCFAHMTSIPPPFMHDVADFVSRLNQNLVKSDASRVLSMVERQTLAMLHRLVYERSAAFYEEYVQRHDATLGIMTSGGTLANLTGLWCARNACFPRVPGFDGVEEAGLAAALRFHDYSGAVVVGSRLVHYSIEKAAAVLGLGSAGVVRVPVDADQCMDLDALERTIDLCARRRQRIVALVGVAGTTDCGSIDPLSGLARIAQREGIHFHVDAAWGSSLLFSPRHRMRLAGMESADSVALDGHKQFYVPIGSGVLLLRDPHQARLLEKQAPYMLHSGSGDLGRFSLDGSRPGVALLIHASMTVIGRDGYAELIDRHLENAAALASLIAASPDFELLHRPQTNIVLYRHVPQRLRRALAEGALKPEDRRELNRVNEALQRTQYDTGACFVSRTTICDLEQYQGMPIVALRAVVRHPFVGTEDMKALLDEQRSIAATLEAECQAAC